MIEAAKGGQVAIVDELIKHGADANQADLVRVLHPPNTFPMHLASRNNAADCLAEELMCQSVKTIAYFFYTDLARTERALSLRHSSQVQPARSGASPPGRWCGHEPGVGGV